MITSDETTLRVLNELIRTGRDAEAGYRLAAADVKVPELAGLFERYARERGDFVADLQARVRVLRGTPPETGTPGGALHRGWIDLKAALESAEAHAVLAECERGEDLAVKAYVAALGEKDVDVQTHTMLQQQYERVQAAHDRVRQLRDSAEYAHR